MKHLSAQFIRFCIVGLIATTISYLTFYIAIEYFSINYLIANIIAFVFGISSGYPLNRAWTFSAKEHKHKHTKIFPYLCVYLFSLLLSLIFLRIVVEYAKIDPKIAFILSIGLTTCTNFIGTKFFVFRHH